MKGTQLARLQEEWLAGNAIVIFVVALLGAQGLQQSDVTYQLPFDLPAPSLPQFVSFPVVALTFVLSLVLALASMVSRLRCWAFQFTHANSHVLSFFVLVAFLVSWMEGYSKLPADQRWSQVLFWGGFLFFLFIIFRSYRTFKTLLQSQG